MSTKLRHIWGTILIIIVWLVGAFIYPRTEMVYRPSDFLDGEWWRAITYLCANEHMIFLVVELIVFVALGWALEREYGSGRFVVLYLATSIVQVLMISLCYLKYDVTVAGSSSVLCLFTAFYYTRNVLHQNRNRISIYAGVTSFAYLVGILVNHILIGKSLFLVVFPFVMGIVIGMISSYRSIWGKDSDMKSVTYNGIGDFLIHCRGTFLLMVGIIFVYTWGLTNQQGAEMLTFHREQILDGQWWRIIFAMLQAENVIGFIISLIMLCIIGRRVERKTGTIMYLLIYALSGILSGLIYLLPIVYLYETNGTYLPINSLLVFLFMMVFTKDSKMMLEPWEFIAMMVYLFLQNIGKVEGGMFTNHLLGIVIGFAIYILMETMGNLYRRRVRYSKKSFHQ